MCVVSGIADSFTDRTIGRYPWVVPYIEQEPVAPPDWTYIVPEFATKVELEAIRKEIQEIRELIKAAQKFDESTGQPNCDNPDKFRLLKLLAEALGVDLSELKLNE